MTDAQPRWLDLALEANRQFQVKPALKNPPAPRQPGSVALITCMDPRINVEALGMPPFDPPGAPPSPVRIIRTLGGMAEARSLLASIFLADIREIALVTHTDCGCPIAHAQIDAIIASMQQRLPPGQFEQFKTQVGAPFRERLREWLKTFTDPREAVRQEAAAVRALPFVPPDVIVHGLVYDVVTGAVEVAVNGYGGSPQG